MFKFLKLACFLFIVISLIWSNTHDLLAGDQKQPSSIELSEVELDCDTSSSTNQAKEYGHDHCGTACFLIPSRIEIYRYFKAHKFVLQRNDDQNSDSFNPLKRPPKRFIS